MNRSAEALWARALHALDRLGYLPANRSLTPAELAAHARRAGDDRLARLVHGWYYPASYGCRPGALSDADAVRLVETLENQISIGRPHAAKSAVTKIRPQPPLTCELCGARVNK